MTRNTGNYEDVVIKYIPYENGSNGAERVFTSKDMTECSDGAYNFNLTDIAISQITVRADTLNETSDYEILIEQEGIDYSFPTAFTQNK